MSYSFEYLIGCVMGLSELNGIHFIFEKTPIELLSSGWQLKYLRT